MSDEKHERIWLEPAEIGDVHPDGRLWCQDNVWGDEADEYILASSVATVQSRISELEDEVDELQQTLWPEWAERILKALQKNGYDPVDNGEVDLADAFEDYLDGIDDAEHHEAKRLAALQYEIAALKAENAVSVAQNEWLKDRLSNLQLPANSTKNIEEWLEECGMPSARAALQNGGQANG